MFLSGTMHYVYTYVCVCVCVCVYVGVFKFSLNQNYGLLLFIVELQMYGDTNIVMIRASKCINQAMGILLK